MQLLYSSKLFSMQKTGHKNINISILQKKIGHLDENEIIRIQLEYVKYVTD
jgi:apolipoprotein N-acyltransferase